jgi:hypothetical protein
MPSLGVMFAMEAAYQTCYQIAQTYSGQYGATDEKFEAAKSFFLTEGAGLAMKSFDTGFNIATGKVVRNAVSDAASTKN